VKRLVFIDVDDTLISPPYDAVKKSAAIFGKPFPTEDEVFNRTHLEFYKAFPKLFRSQFEMWALAILAIPFGYFRSQRPLKLNIPKVSRCLRDDRVYLITKNPPIFTRWRINRLRDIFSVHLGDRYIACGPMFSKGQSKIKIMEEVAHSRGVDIKSCILIDDSVDNIHEALSAGAQAALIGTHWGRRQIATDENRYKGIPQIEVADLHECVQSFLGQLRNEAPVTTLVLPPITIGNFAQLIFRLAKLRFLYGSQVPSRTDRIPAARSPRTSIFFAEPQKHAFDRLLARIQTGVGAKNMRVLTLRGSTILTQIEVEAAVHSDSNELVKTIRRAAHTILIATGHRLPTDRLYYFVGHRKATEVRRVLESPELVSAIREHAESHGLPEHELRALATKYANDIISPRSYLGCVMGDLSIQFLQKRVFSKVVVDFNDDITRVEHERFLVYASIHRSYLDSGLLYSALCRRTSSYPYIIAANKMKSVWIGRLGARAGAIFVERKFIDNIYAAVLTAHIRDMQKNGHSLEVFLEGQRSRTGLTLEPKKGIASIVWNNLAKQGAKVALVPVSFAYNKIPESEMLLPESFEDRKKKGSASLREIADMHIKQSRKRSRSKRSKYRAIWRRVSAEPISECYMRFGDLINFDAESVSKSKPDTKDELREHLLTTMHSINSFTHVLPSSVLCLAVLGAEDHHLTKQEAAKFLDLSKSLLAAYQGIPQLAQLNGGTSPSQVEEFLQLPFTNRKFKRHGLSHESILSITDLDIERASYYRNNILHFFVLPALLSSILIESGTGRIEELHRFLNHMFAKLTSRYFLPSLRDAGAFIDETLSTLSRQGLITVQNSIFCVNAESDTHRSLEILAHVGSSMIKEDLSDIFEMFRRSFNRIETNAEVRVRGVTRSITGTAEITNISVLGCFLKCNDGLKVGDTIRWYPLGSDRSAYSGIVVRTALDGAGIQFDSSNETQEAPAGANPELRRAKRTHLSQPGTVTFTRPLPFHGSVSNISPTGAMLSASHSFSPSDRIGLTIKKGELSIDLDCIVGRLSETGVGVKFDVTDREKAAELSLFIERLIKQDRLDSSVSDNEASIRSERALESA
jgi:hypothetical protein